jgi:hypothetical protein
VLPFAFSLVHAERSGDMDKKQNIEKSAEYQIGNTTSSVTPVFGVASQAENIEEKITRLILQDKKHKGAKP